MYTLGIIGGTSLLQSSFLAHLRPVLVDTPYGQTRIFVGNGLAFVQRHLSSPSAEYRPPHLINFRAFVYALATLGVPRVVSFCSVGGLRAHAPPGSLFLCDDFFQLEPITLYDDKRGHIVPRIDAALTDDLYQVVSAAGISIHKGGVYAQMKGPRFETPAEIRFLAAYGDVIGMTGAHEGTLFSELNTPFALICSVDNFANGIADKPLTEAEFHANVKVNMVQVSPPPSTPHPPPRRSSVSSRRSSRRTPPPRSTRRLTCARRLT
jgi:5'-methylthioadenosine phosphorylase